MSSLSTDFSFLLVTQNMGYISSLTVATRTTEKRMEPVCTALQLVSHGRRWKHTTASFCRSRSIWGLKPAQQTVICVLQKKVLFIGHTCSTLALYTCANAHQVASTWLGSFKAFTWRFHNTQIRSQRLKSPTLAKKSSSEIALLWAACRTMKACPLADALRLCTT